VITVAHFSCGDWFHLSTFNSNHTFGGGACACACTEGCEVMLMVVAKAVVVDMVQNQESRVTSKYL
jgi:hypothetical protein